MAARYVVGIDLGTTNCVLAYAAAGCGAVRIELLRVPQLVSPSTVEPASLPSFVYLASEHEASGGALDLPWRASELRRGPVRSTQGGRGAGADRRRGQVLVGHSRVDRRQSILPWNAPKSAGKISPVTASQRYLEHLGRGLGLAVPRRPPGSAASRADGAGLVRRRGPRTDSRRRRLRPACPPTSCCWKSRRPRVYSWLDLGRRSLAGTAEGGRPAAGLRCRRRHHRPDAHRRR